MSELLDRDHFVAAKLAWQRGLLIDKSLTSFAKVFGAFLMHDLHSQKGGAWRSQRSLAELLAVEPRTIRRATRELEKAGHLRVTASPGRGKSNFYEPLVREPETAAQRLRRRSAPSPLGPESRTPMSDSRLVGRTSQSGAGAETRIDGVTSPDTRALPSLLDSNISPPRPPRAQAGGSQGGEPRAPVSGIERRRDERALTKDQRLASPGRSRSTFRNAQVRAHIASHIGEAATASYLDPAAWRESDQTIVCRLGIAAHTLRTRAGPALRELGVAVTHDAEAHHALTSNVVALAEVA